MKLNCTVVGVGTRKKGIGKKSGQPYDFTEISCIFPFEGVDGERAETFAVDTSLLSGREISSGDTLQMIVHQANFKTYVDFIF